MNSTKKNFDRFLVLLFILLGIVVTYYFIR